MSFSFYQADSNYCDFLRETDPCVPYTRDEKKNRPFIGIVVEVNGFNYYAPLSSPKEKHLQMKNQIDFIKINNGKLGAINFNNMIPIHISCLKPIDINIKPTDDKSTKEYKNLLADQLYWCNKSENVLSIRKKAKGLYKTVIKKTGSKSLLKRCCDFRLDEIQYLRYCAEHNLEVEHLKQDGGKLPTLEKVTEHKEEFSEEKQKISEILNLSPKIKL